MLPNLTKLAATATLALAMVVAGCDSLGEQRLLGPSEAGQSDATTGQKTYAILKGVWTDRVRVDEEIVTPGTRNADVGVAGNVLIIPKGAVDQRTLFRMTLSEQNVDGTTHVKVNLQAFQQDASGAWTVDVGEKGFLKPLKLRMTYDWATDPIKNEKQLRIVWLKEDGAQEVYTTTLDASRRTVSTFLDHFSEYGIGWPNKDELLF